MHDEILKMIATSGFLTAPECTKFVFGRGSAPDHAGRAYDALPDPLVGWGGGNLLPIPHPLDAFGISPLDAFGISYPTPKSVGVDAEKRRRLCPPPPLSKVWLRRWILWKRLIRTVRSFDSEILLVVLSNKIIFIFWDYRYRKTLA